MPPKLNASWRFFPPEGIQKIEDAAVWEFNALIEKIASQGNRWKILEIFKGTFAGVIGSVHVKSSSEGWASSDLQSYMTEASANPPVFIWALLEGLEAVQSEFHYEVPNSVFINQLCARQQIPVAVIDDEIRLTTASPPSIPVPQPPISLREEAGQLLSESVNRSEQLLNENHGREAVQEILWVLESLSTGFRGINSDAGQVKGKYFNRIVQELKQANIGTTLQQALEWCEQLHGYLSSPTGGAIRHGIDIKEGNPISTDEARFFCNLIRSYVGFLQSEHNRICGGA
jgi:hypothetical protein